MSNYVSKDDVFKYAKLIALASEQQVKSGERNPKAPCISWNKDPNDYIGYNDAKYGTGIRCGYIKKLDKYLIVFDLDNHNKDDIPMKILSELLQDQIKNTYTVFTPNNGLHIYLLSENKPKASDPPINVDYRPKNYVVADYIYDRNGKKQHYTGSSHDQILVVPDSDLILKDLLTKLEQKGYINTPVQEHIDNITAIVRNGIRKGTRNDYCLSLSGYLRKKDFPFEKAQQIVRDAFSNDEELNQRLDTVKRTYQQDIKNVIGWKDLKKYLNNYDLDELERLVGDGIDLKGRILSKLSSNKEPRPKQLADYVNSELFLMHDPKLKKYYERYEDGSIREIDETRITEFLNQQFGENEISRNKRRNVLGYVSKIITTNHDLIQFKNGTLNTRTREFTTDKGSINQIPKLTLPFNWDPEAKPGMISKLIDDVLDNPKYPNNKEKWLRAVGHAFMGTNRINKMVIIQGESGTGKSTLTTILKRIFYGHYSEIKTQDIVANERFTLYGLINKAINIDDDISNGMLKGIGNLNTICSGNGLYVEIKGENKGIQAENQEIPRLFANGNSLPPVIGSGLERRLLLIHADNKISHDKRDDYLQSDILTGLYDQDGIEWLIYHTINLYLDKQDEPVTSEVEEAEMSNLYEYMSYPLKKGVEEIFVESWQEEDFLEKRDVYRYLKKWCQIAYSEGKIIKEHSKPSTRQMNRAMKDAGFEEGRKMVKSESMVIYEYIKLNDRWKAILEQEKVINQHTLYQDTITQSS